MIVKGLKKTISCIIAIVMLLSIIPLFINNSSAYSIGDLNNDGKVNAIDSALLTQQVLGKETPRLVSLKGDINSDEKINSIDVSLMTMIILGSYLASETPYEITSITLGGTDISEYSVVLPNEYPVGTYQENAEYAFEILQKFVLSSCGIKLQQASSATGHCITFVYDEEYGDEAFNIEISSGQVVIRCGLARGPIYAAYGFLESVLGYKFYPKEEVALKKCGIVSVESGFSHTEGLNTIIRSRNIYTRAHYKWRSKVKDPYSTYYKDSTISNHITSTWSDMFMMAPKYGYATGSDRSHSFDVLMPDRALNDIGKYCLSDKENWDICESNLRIYIDSLIENGYIPGVNMPMISISMSDSSDWCLCRTCKGAARDYGAKSATLIIFLNEVISRITPDYAGIEFWTLAYGPTLQAPVGLELADNLYICYAPIGHCIVHSFEENCKISYTSDLEGWQKLTDNIYFWWYATMYYETAIYAPQYYWTYENIKYLNDNNIKGIVLENEDNSLGFSDIISYGTSIVAWNPDITFDEWDNEMKTFMTDYYGSEKVYDLIILLESCKSDTCFNNLEYKYDTVPCYDYSKTQANYEKIFKLIESIRDSVDSSKLSRINRALAQIEFTIISICHKTEYVNGNSDQREVFTRRYKVLYDNLVALKNAFYYSYFYTAYDAKTPDEFNPSVSPLTWYYKVS